MQKKLAVILAIFAISGGLLARGSQNANVQETDEMKVEEASPTSEDVATPEVKVEEPTEAEKENETEPTEEVQEKVAPIWYMDEEGIKSEELGIMIKRDSAEWSQFGFSGEFQITVPSDTPNTHTSMNFNYKCSYYEGDVDSYIAEHKGMEKKVLEDIAYAAKEPNENSTNREVVFVQNGIALSITLWDYDIETIWKNGLEVYEEETEYLVYTIDKVLYCPALGVKFSGTEEDDWLDSVDIYCSDFGYNADHTAYVGGYISIKSINSKLNPNSNADERITEFVNNRVNYGSTAIEEPVEKTLGNYKFKGKGCLDEYGSEDWVLTSDEASYDITVSFSDNFELENYLTMIEGMN